MRMCSDQAAHIWFSPYTFIRRKLKRLLAPPLPASKMKLHTNSGSGWKSFLAKQSEGLPFMTAISLILNHVYLQVHQLYQAKLHTMFR